MSVVPKRLAFFALLTCAAGCARGYGPVDGEPSADAGVTLDAQAGAASYADESDHNALEAGAALFAEGVVAQSAPKPSPASGLALSDAAVQSAGSGAGDGGPAQAFVDAAAVTPTNPPASSLPTAPDAGSSAAIASVPEAGTPAQAVQPVVDAGAAAATTPAVLDAGTSSAASACTPGAFSGAFDGKIAVGTGTSLTVSGSVALTLSVGSDGQSLQITRGVVTAAGPGGVPLQATLSGYVDCASGQLREGKLNGSYGQDGSSTRLAFAGDASGQYASQAGALDGTWTASVAATPVQATGTFSATRAP